MGRAPQISRDAVLAAALKLADEHGLEAVTMHAVARSLRVTPMALYRHVDDKNALLDGLVEVLLTEYPLPPRGAGTSASSRWPLRSGTPRAGTPPSSRCC